MQSAKFDRRRVWKLSWAGAKPVSKLRLLPPVSPMAEILPTHTPELFEKAVKRAVELLRCGEVVALPTETVYGLAANALNEAAVRRIFEIKGRPATNPIIVHVASLEMARRCATEWPLAAERLAAAFWPGPLTLVLPRTAGIPDTVTAGGPTVGLRWPSHPFIQAVIRACGFPLAAPSANRSTSLSPTNAEHVRKSLGRRIKLIIDGGQSQVGIESTVVDVTIDPAQVLRPGMIIPETIVAVSESIKPLTDPFELRSPGLMLKHYAPKARLVVLRWIDDQNLRQQIAGFGAGRRRWHVIAHTRIPLGLPPGQVSVIPHDPEAFARALYAELHRCDEAETNLIVVEEVPDTREWSGIRDRLRRASASS